MTYLLITIFFFFSNIAKASNLDLDLEKSSVKFYQTGTGYKIMDENNYSDEVKSDEVKQFLKDELEFFRKKLKKDRYDALIEIGSAKSVKAPFIVEQGIKYLGLDINRDFVDEANKSFIQNKISLKAQSKNISVLELEADFYQAQQINKPLIIFPFNLFGNLSDPINILKVILNLKQDFIISSYKIDEKSRIAREKYYSNCGYKNLKYKEDNDKFALFTADDGLNSRTYNINYLEKLIKESSKDLNSDIKISHQEFNHIGIATFVKF